MFHNSKKGFTIVELVVVIAVVAVLAAVLIPTFASILNKADEAADIQVVKNMNTALAADQAVDGKPENLIDVKNAILASGLKVDAEATADGMIFVYDYETNRVLYVNENERECTYPEDSKGKYDENKQWMRFNDKYVAFTSAQSSEFNNVFLPTYQLSNNIALTADLTVSSGATGGYCFDFNGFEISGDYDVKFESAYAGISIIKNGNVNANNYTVDMPKAHVIHEDSLIVSASANAKLTTSSASYILRGDLEVAGTLEILSETKLVKAATANLKFEDVNVAATATVFAENNSGASEKIEGSKLESIKTVYVAEVGSDKYEDIYEALAAVNEAASDVTLKLLANVNLGTKAFDTGSNDSLKFTNDADITVTVDLNGFNITGTSSFKGNHQLIYITGSAKVVFKDDTTNPGSIIFKANVDNDINSLSAVINVTTSTANKKLSVEINNINVIHNGGTYMSYAFELNTNSGNDIEIDFKSNNALIQSTYIAIRNFLNGNNAVVNSTINGGNINGDRLAVWFQIPNEKITGVNASVDFNDVEIVCNEENTEPDGVLLSADSKHEMVSANGTYTVKPTE